MKFAIHLAGHLTPEWQSQYIEYRKMKTMLYQMEEARKIAIASSQTNSFLQSPIPDPSNERFFRLCETELEKINAFFLQKLTEAKRKCQFLKNELENGCSNHQPGHSRALRSTKNRRWTSEMKMALSELYLLLVLIQNYQTLNFTGFRKILKKHDKLFATTQGAEWRERYVETSPLFKEKEVDSMITTVEDLFTKKLADGNRHEAMKRLRVPPLEEKQSPQSTFSVGLLLGMLAVIVPFCVFTSYTLDNVGGILFPWTPAFLLYRSLFIICLHVTLVGVNIYGWSVAGINHVLIFEVNPRKHLTYQQVIQIGMFLMLCLVLSIFVFIVCTNYDLRPFVQPLVLFIFILVYLFNPLPFCKFRSRIWLLKRFAKLITAPFHYVMFADFWIGDQMTSLVLPFTDLQYIFCFYIVNYDWKTHSWQNDRCKAIHYVHGILLSLPAWFRFCQCLRRYRDSGLVFPHVFNALKYSTTFVKATTYVLFRIKYSQFTSASTNPFFYIHVLSYALENTYKCYWDIKVDWGFFDKDTGSNRFLREHIVYPSKFYYYAAIIQNIVLRYTWIIGLYIMAKLNFKYDETYKFIAAVLEVFRRHIWNYFRLENEHLNNCGLFRAVRDISIMPISADKAVSIERLMDDLDGVQNRPKTQGSPSTEVQSNPNINNMFKRFQERVVRRIPTTVRV